MTKVVKRDGRKQAFNSVKIKKSVLKACRDAGCSSATKKEIMTEMVMPTIAVLKKKARVKSTDIRALLLRKFDKKAKGVARAWRSNEKKKKE